MSGHHTNDACVWWSKPYRNVSSFVSVQHRFPHAISPFSFRHFNHHYYSSSTLSFIPGLKLILSTNPFHHRLPITCGLYSLTLTTISGFIVLLCFYFFSYFLRLFSFCDRLGWKPVGSWVHAIRAPAAADIRISVRGKSIEKKYG